MSNRRCILQNRNPVHVSFGPPCKDTGTLHSRRSRAVKSLIRQKMIKHFIMMGVVETWYHTIVLGGAFTKGRNAESHYHIHNWWSGNNSFDIIISSINRIQHSAVMYTFRRTNAKFFVLVALLAQLNHPVATSMGKFHWTQSCIRTCNSFIVQVHSRIKRKENLASDGSWWSLYPGRRIAVSANFVNTSGGSELLSCTLKLNTTTIINY